MKIKSLYSFLKAAVTLVLVFVCFACKEDSSPSRSKVRVQTQIIALSEEEGTTIRTIISGDVPVSSMDCVELIYAKNADMSSQSVAVIAQGTVSDTIITQMPVEAGETYYFKYRLSNEISSYTSEVEYFTISMDYEITNFWIEKQGVPNYKCTGTIGFAINGMGYIGLGKRRDDVKMKSLWRYDPADDVWTEMAEMPYAEGLDMATAFVIDGKAYVTLGLGKDFYSISTYRYSPDTDSWEQMAKFPGKGRTGATSFVVGKKAYIVGGYADKIAYTDEVWCYDSENDNWTQKESFIGGKLTGMYSFTLGRKTFVGGGYDSTHTFNSKLFWYDANTDIWSLEGIESPKTAYSVGFSGDECAYIAGGTFKDESLYEAPNHFYKFDGLNWEGLGLVGSDTRNKASGFRIDNNLYMGMGENSTYNPLNSLLQYQIVK